MRTTIRLNEDLFKQAKETAIKSGRTLTTVIEDALRQALVRKEPQSRKRRIRLISSGVGGLRPGVNLDRSAELLDIMDESDATD